MSDKKILFLCSGGGGNLRFIHQAVLLGWLPSWQNIAVITDRECPAADYARQHKIPFSRVNLKNSGQEMLLGQALSHKPDLVISNINKIINETVVAAFAGKMLNLHYSLLPSFAGNVVLPQSTSLGIGVRPVKAAMDYGVCLGGVTVHQVVAEVDAGSPVTQIAIPFAESDSLEELMDIKFRSGCIALLNAVCIFDGIGSMNNLGEVLQIKGRNVLINPSCGSFPKALFQEKFWGSIK